MIERSHGHPWRFDHSEKFQLKAQPSNQSHKNNTKHDRLGKDLVIERTKVEMNLDIVGVFN